MRRYNTDSHFNAPTQLRKSFADKYRHEDKLFWYSWWFSDEVTIDCTDGDYIKWSFYQALLLITPQGKRLHKDKVQARRRPVRYSQMFYGAINYNKPSTVIPLPGDPESKRGGVTGRRILSCLQSYLPDLIEEGETFQHDNARTFTYRKTEIEDNVVKNVIKSMPDRLNEYYRANGYYT
ncbi:unnamed protein product, partial [Fusarium fujikuroi]